LVIKFQMEIQVEVNKEKMKSFRRNLKGISPIFATLILIAIAVIAGVVVYMFTSGTLATMTSGGTAGQEKVSVQAVQYSTSTFNVTLYVQSTAGPNPVVSSIIIKDSSGNTVYTVGLATATPITPAPTITSGALSTGILYNINSAPLASSNIPAGTYTATLVTKAGGSFVSPSFVVQ
jgi:flagellin-like protein